MTATLTSVSLDSGDGVQRLADKDVREYRPIYHVTTTTAGDGPQTVLATPGLPTIGETYAVDNDADPNALCLGLTPRRDSNNPKVWHVEAFFTNQFDSLQLKFLVYDRQAQQAGQPIDSPLDHPREIRVSHTNVRKTLTGAYDNSSLPSSDGFQRGMAMSNGEMADPQPEVDDSRPVFEVTENVSSITSSDLLDWANSVNHAAFLGAKARCFKMDSPVAEKQFDENIGAYWRVTYRLEYNRDTWDIQYPNIGSYYVSTDGSGGYNRHFVKGPYGEVAQWVPLNSTGGFNNNINSSEVTFTKIQYYKKKNFGDLNWPSTIFG